MESRRVSYPTIHWNQEKSFEDLLTNHTDETGSLTATRGIFMVYDVFGLYIQTLKGADILASGYAPANDTAGDFKVFMPDFFGDHPQDIANFPPKTPAQIKSIMDYMTGPADPAKTVPLIAPMMEEIKKQHPELTTFAIFGTCWGGKIAALVSQEGSLFEASAQVHPSLLDINDASKVAIPMVVLPSMDEDVEVSVIT
jgi:dienelactone hydrolase